MDIQTQLIRVEEDKEKTEQEMMRQGRDLEMLQNTIQKSQRERENMQSEMDVLLDRINKMSDMLDKSRVCKRFTVYTLYSTHRYCMWYTCMYFLLYTVYSVS